MPPKATVEITNLAEFRRDLKRAVEASPSELTRAIKVAGQPVLHTTESLAERSSRTGLMARSYSLRASGSSGTLINRTPYGAGAEWGSHGKWRGFNKYGPPGRFAWRATEIEADQIMKIMTEELHDLISLHGWAT